MSGFVQWTDAPGGNGGTNYLTMVSGNTYKVRPLLIPINFHKYFNKVDGKTRTAVVTEEVVAQMANKYPELGKPANRYGMYVIDRNDDNKIKILEFPITVYKAFVNSFEATKKKPGSRTDGSDWLIKKSGAGLKTSYEATFVDYTPLTQGEYDALMTLLDGNMKKIATFFPFLSLADAEKKLFASEEDSGQIDSSGTPASASASTTESADDFDPDW